LPGQFTTLPTIRIALWTVGETQIGKGPMAGESALFRAGIDRICKPAKASFYRVVPAVLQSLQALFRVFSRG